MERPRQHVVSFLKTQRLMTPHANDAADANDTVCIKQHG